MASVDDEFDGFDKHANTTRALSSTFPSSPYDDHDDHDLYPHDPLSPRLNRWRGYASSWMRLTAHDRAAADGLEKLRDADLGAHLFNAVALHKRADRMQAHGQTDVWRPQRSWTAWPLVPALVPREGERVGPPDPLEAYTIAREDRGESGSGRVLVEEMRATVLRMAKKRWRADIRRAEQEGGASMDEEHGLGFISSGQGVGTDTDTTSGFRRVKRDKSRYLKPTFSDDDTHAAKLVDPIIERVMDKVDVLLRGLHEQRQLCINLAVSRRASSAALSRARSLARSEQDENTDASTPTAKRGRGRPRKFVPSGGETSEPTTPRSADDRIAEAVGSWRAKVVNRGRRRKEYPILDNETEQEYLIRVARLQKKAMPSFAQPLPRSTSPSRSRSVSRHSIRSDGSSTAVTESGLGRSQSRSQSRRPFLRLGLRDWSEVLGMAGATGFDARVLERATKRCAALFDEEMTWRYLDYNRSWEGADRVQGVGYSPTFSSTDTEQAAHSHKHSHKRAMHSTLNDMTTCPMQGCQHERLSDGDPLGGLAMVTHLKEVHDLDDEAIQALMYGEEDSEEEMEAGMHVDGFLRPIKKRSGWRTGDVRPRKRRRENVDRDGLDGSASASMRRSGSGSSVVSMGGSEDEVVHDGGLDIADDDDRGGYEESLSEEEHSIRTSPVAESASSA